MGILARSKAFKQSRDLPVACRDSKVRLVEVCADEYATRRSRENRFQSALSLSITNVLEVWSRAR